VTSTTPAHRAAERAARQSYGKLVAYLAARTGDVATAEDALADAFAGALASWPSGGVPQAPEARLLAAARRRMIDMARRRRTREAAADRLLLSVEEAAEGMDAAELPDWRLRLMFACAHPAIDAATRGPLMLQTVLGLDAAAIAVAFLTAPKAMSQRLVRAKRRIRDTGIPFHLPDRAELPARLEAVLEAIYAAFASGWPDPVGLDARRQELLDEAVWLGQVLVGLLPEEPEGLGLLALMLYAGARRAARRSAKGDYVPLSEQDPRLWDAAAIDQAERLLQRASSHGRMGRFQLEAAVQSVHAARRTSGMTDWGAILELYDGLLAVTGSPVVAVNRAVALNETMGPAAGLAALDELVEEQRLATYQPYWAARADLLARLGQRASADAAYPQASFWSRTQWCAAFSSNGVLGFGRISPELGLNSGSWPGPQGGIDGTTGRDCHRRTARPRPCDGSRSRMQRALGACGRPYRLRCRRNRRGDCRRQFFGAHPAARRSLSRSRTTTSTRRTFALMTRRLTRMTPMR
jgi:RNA polymerase sigma-70 factor (ECF subfamily)